MRVEKRVLCEEGVRRVPEQFSWVDHRLVRDGYIGAEEEEKSGGNNGFIWCWPTPSALCQ